VNAVTADGFDASRPQARRLAELDWARVRAELDESGSAPLGRALSARECRDLVQAYDDAALFRATIDMVRHRFGSGQHRYFDYPPPDLVAGMRAAAYSQLLPTARDWAAKLARPAPWPEEFEEWLGQCHAAGQRRPTPILLRYRAGDWNALHRDLYGGLVFPLQVVICLDEPEVDFTGGEFLTVEQRPRAQSRATVRRLAEGEGLVFTTCDRPVRSTRGWTAAPMRHGVSTLLSGTRHTLGLVVHDAT
jgi:hypothetical protein